jgi:predicted ATPase/class 3 adenylate cyclase
MTLVTFLFTDIEGSTQLFQRRPDDYPRAVARHHEILREIVLTRGGRVFETVGDAVYAAFPRCVDGVLASIEGQRALRSEAWADVGEIRVRMGLHTAEAEFRDNHYYGPAIQRCERVMSAGHGGQVLLSSAAADALTADHPPDGVHLQDMGTHRLRGLSSEERISQLRHSDLRSEFPSLKTLTTFLSKLPERRGVFIEPGSASSDLRRLLTGSRLVTITGGPGIGKTRVALELLMQLLNDYPDGAWFVAVDSTGATPSTVEGRVAETLGLAAEYGRDPSKLLEHLGSKQMLLTIDGCDRLLTASAQFIDAALRHSRHLRILATSRERLAIGGEAAYGMPSLSNQDAVRLFLTRAAEVRPDFRPTEADAPLLQELASVLDGVPSALEAAASKLTKRSLSEILSTARRRRSSDPAVALLGPAEQTLLERASVFDDTWTLESAELIVSGPQLPRAAVLDLVSALVDKSVVITRTMDDGSIRYQIPEHLRRYGLRRLAERGELADLRTRVASLRGVTAAQSAS